MAPDIATTWGRTGRRRGQRRASECVVAPGLRSASGVARDARTKALRREKRLALRGALDDSVRGDTLGAFATREAS